jgi:ADP-ribosylglycohydrolase
MGNELASALAGGVWGHLIGDALGVPYEFTPRRKIGRVEWGHVGTYGQPSGTWSDDGGLILSLLDSLLAKGFDLEDQGRRAVKWMDEGDYKPGERFDIGNTTRRALERVRAGMAAELAGGEGEDEVGNGSLMRILPIALVMRATVPHELARLAMRASRVTHRQPRAQLVCGLYTLIAQALLGGASSEEAMTGAQIVMRTLAQDGDEEAWAAIVGYEERNGSGYAVDSFWSAWEALSGARDYEDAVVRAVRMGNDTDTTAAVAGGLAGIHWGLEGIPQEWRTGMRGQEIVQPLVARLLAS